jgi:hypothetical protein
LEYILVGQQPTKAELSQLLKAQCDQALLLDNSIQKTYESQGIPERIKYRPRKIQKDSFLNELERMQEADAAGSNSFEAGSVANSEASSVFDVSALEREAAEFMRVRRRK